jgi:hypothetical protein
MCIGMRVFFQSSLVSDISSGPLPKNEQNPPYEPFKTLITLFRNGKITRDRFKLDWYLLQNGSEYEREACS